MHCVGLPTFWAIFFTNASGHPEPNPTTSINSASVVHFYNATSSLARTENKNILFYFKKTLLPTATLAL
jgi:hypothetical protein